MVSEWDIPGLKQQSQEDNHKHPCTKCYDVSNLLYVETDASSIGLGTGMLQVGEGMSIGTGYIRHIAWAQKFHHDCSAKEVYVTTDHKPLVTMVNKDVAMLSQWLQCIMLHIYQYSMYTLYKSGSELYIVDWLSHHNHMGNRDQELAGMNINIHTYIHLAQQ